MSMSKKHYIAIAHAIKTSFKVNDAKGFETALRIGNELAEIFKADSPDFKKKRFLEACGLSIDYDQDSPRKKD